MIDFWVIMLVMSYLKTVSVMHLAKAVAWIICLPLRGGMFLGGTVHTNQARRQCRVDLPGLRMSIVGHHR